MNISRENADMYKQFQKKFHQKLFCPIVRTMHHYILHLMLKCKRPHCLELDLNDQKSVNLQLITLGCLDDGTNESSTKNLMFQV